MADYKLIGKNYVTPDLVAKVTGKARYAEDYRAEGMLFCKLLLSPRPHARITRIDTSAALAMPGVLAVLTADDMPAPPAPPAPPVIVAIGNHANDASLLAVARHAFVINNPDAGHHPALITLPGATPLSAVGPAGWLEMLGRLPSLLAGAHP